MAAICALMLVSGTQSTGFLLCWGAIAVYLASYLRLHDSRANLNTVSTLPYIYGITWSIGTIVGTWSFHKLGGRVTVTLGALLYSGGLAAASLLTDMYECLGILLGTAGLGQATMCLPATYLSWVALPHNKGLATGLAWLSFGFGGMIYSVFFTFLVNPYNKAPEWTVRAGDQTEKLFTESIAGQVPLALRVSALAVLVLALGGVAFLIEVKDKTVRKRLSASLSAKELSEDDTSGCPSLKLALKTRSFYLLFLFCWLSIQFPMIFLYQFKNYGLEYSSNDHFLSLVGTSGLFVNACARFLLTWLGDYISFRRLLLILTVGTAVLALTMPLIVGYPYVYGLWVCLIFAANGGLYTPITLLCGQTYGTLVGTKVFSLISQGQNLSSLTMIPATLFLIQVSSRQPYGYGTACCVLSAAPGLSAALIAALKVNYKWPDRKLSEALAK